LSLRKGNIDIFEFLLENGSNPNERNETQKRNFLIHEAVTLNNLKAILLLMKYGAEIDSTDTFRFF